MQQVFQGKGAPSTRKRPLDYFSMEAGYFIVARFHFGMSGSLEFELQNETQELIGKGPLC